MFNSGIASALVYPVSSGVGRLHSKRGYRRAAAGGYGGGAGLIKASRQPLVPVVGEMSGRVVVKDMGMEVAQMGRKEGRNVVVCAGKRKVVTYSNTFQQLRKPAILSATQMDKGVEKQNTRKEKIMFHGMHHVGLLCENLERSMEFYMGVLGLEMNQDRPDDKLPYRGAWLWIGPEMIHLMELPNPDPLEGRPEHGGRDRHFCVGVEDIGPLEERLKQAGVSYTRSKSGRAAIFFRDPDMNCLEQQNYFT
eukprot:jgi/Picsp_1/976/NSC_04460-R1_glyoxalase bleomycin resistance protein dioxygenase